jgi:hypothetical protein
MRWTNDLCFNPASRRQSEREGALLDRLFLRPQSRREGRNNPELRGEGEVGRYQPILAADYLKMRLDASKPAQADRAGA